MVDDLRKLERSAATVFTVAAVALNYLAATTGGALWRDEANTVALATLPSIGEVWKNLQYDSFPILWLLVIRCVAGLFGSMNDPAFRSLGFLVGVALVGALWFNARSIRNGFPLLSLCLVSMAPSVITWGDSMRAYGFGIVLVLITCALLWRFLEKADSLRFIALLIAAIASVQTLFYNAVVLLALCAGAVAVCADAREWKKAGLVIAIGTVAATSLIPYVRVINEASTWNTLVRIPNYDVSRFLTKLSETLRPGGFWSFFLWLQLFVISVFVAQRTLRRTGASGLSQEKRRVIVFSVVSLGVGVFGVFVFLRTLSYSTEPWYYLALLALTGVCIENILEATISSQKIRMIRLVSVTLLGGLTFLTAAPEVRLRLTNVDLIASKIRTLAAANDLVLVTPWHNGVSFDRYYRPPPPWVTSPPLAFHRFHRYDLFKQQMQVMDQTTVLRPIFDEAERSLKSGNRVFIVGYLELLPPNEVPSILPSAPLPRSDWSSAPYYHEWGTSLGDFLRRHVVRVSVIPVATPGPVNAYEDLELLVASGWRN